MKSLSQLNTRSSTSLDYSDTRSAGVVFDRVPQLYDLDRIIDITSLDPTVDPNVEIQEIVNYTTAAVEFTITTNDITGSTISWPALSSNLSVNNVGNVWTVSGFKSAADWETAREFNWNLPADYADDPFFYLDVSLSYFDQAQDQRVSVDWAVYDIDHYFIQGDASVTAQFDLSCDAVALRFFNDLYTITNPEASSYTYGAETGLAITSTHFAIGDYINNVVRVYDLSTGNLLHTISNPNPYVITTNDSFGLSVGLNSTQLIVGAPFEDTSTVTNAGRAYIFDLSTGNLQRTLTSSSSNYPRFGYNTFLTDTVAIISGSLGDDTQDAVHLFNSSTGSLITTVTGPVDGVDAYSTGSFGTYMSASATKFAVGLPSWEPVGAAGPSLDKGKVYVYNNSNGSLVYSVENPNNTDISFGRNVGIYEDWLAVGTDDGIRIYYQGNYQRTIGASDGTTFYYNYPNNITLSENYIYYRSNFVSSPNSSSGTIVAADYTTGEIVFTFDDTLHRSAGAVDSATETLLTTDVDTGEGIAHIYQKNTLI